MQRSLALLTLLLAAAVPAPVRADRTQPRPVGPVGPRTARLGATTIALEDRAGGAGLRQVPAAGAPLACGPWPGAWGLWVADVDRDGLPEILVAMRKPARFDPVVENRLHVYALRAGRCVPLWRGSRLAGRFDRLAPDGAGLWVDERIGHGRRRLARYVWNGFGYHLVREIWRGPGPLPAAHSRRFAP
jgi:hypothetical protein